MSSILSEQVQSLAKELSGLLAGCKFEHLKTGGLYVFKEIVIDEPSLTFSVLYESKVRQSCLWIRSALKFFDGRFVPASALEPRALELIELLRPFFEAPLPAKD